MPPIKVGLTGGIGSGKSVVSKMFRLLGVDVYDTDTQAKRIMTSDAGVVAAIKARFGADMVCDEMLDRAALARVVFCDKLALTDLEKIVHPAVISDFQRWAFESRAAAGYVMVESAILFDSGMDTVIDFTVTVSAPEQIRLERVVQRDGVTALQVTERMKCQMTDSQREKLSNYVICNDDQSLVWEQVNALDAIFRSKAAEITTK